jgi:DNA-binding transcriptional ArsR family regulator
MANNQQALNTLFSALSDPTRREVIRLLSQGSASVGELSQPFDMALPSFMKHLKMLEDCGIVVSRKSGRVRTCSLNPKSLGQAEMWLRRQQLHWEQRADRMAAYAEKIATEENANECKDQI